MNDYGCAQPVRLSLHRVGLMEGLCRCCLSLRWAGTWCACKTSLWALAVKSQAAPPFS